MSTSRDSSTLALAKGILGRRGLLTSSFSVSSKSQRRSWAEDRPARCQQCFRSRDFHPEVFPHLPQRPWRRDRRELRYLRLCCPIEKAMESRIRESCASWPTLLQSWPRCRILVWPVHHCEGLILTSVSLRHWGGKLRWIRPQQVIRARPPQEVSPSPQRLLASQTLEPVLRP